MSRPALGGWILLVLLGLPGTVANGTNRVGILVQNLTATAGFRRHGIDAGRVAPILVPTALGAVSGAALVSRLPDAAFERLFGLVMLILLQAVLGFDNLLYISMESKRVEESERQKVRRLGIGIAIALRILLLFVLTRAIGYFQDSFLDVDTAPLHMELSGHALIVLLGGGFAQVFADNEPDIANLALGKLQAPFGFSELGPDRFGSGRKYSLMSSDWKYCLSTDVPDELYDLRNDPYELENVMVTSYSVNAVGNDEVAPTIVIGNNFEKIKVTYTENDSKGKKKGNVEYSWKVEEGEK